MTVRGTCPECGAEATLRQVGRCVYGSCGCRWQGTIAPPLPRAPERPRLFARYVTVTDPVTGLRRVVRQPAQDTRRD
jgi:hypothetical protein